MAQRHPSRAQAQPGPKPGRSGANSGVARIAWYAGLGAMAAFELVEWPLALLIGVTHAIETRSHDQIVEELASGVDAGA